MNKQTADYLIAQGSVPDLTPKAHDLETLFETLHASRPYEYASKQPTGQAPSERRCKECGAPAGVVTLRQAGDGWVCVGGCKKQRYGVHARVLKHYFDDHAAPGTRSEPTKGQRKQRKVRRQMEQASKRANRR